MGTGAADRIGLGIALTLVATLCFASMDGVSKTLVGAYAVAQIVWVRYMVFAGFAAVVAVRRHGRGALATVRPWLQILRGIVLLAEIAVFVAVFRHMALADAHALAASGPLMATALSALMLGERVGPRRWTAVAVGFAGVLIILRPGLGVVDPWALVALFGAFLFALYQVLTRMLTRDDTAESTLLWTGLVGLAVTSVAGPLYWVPPAGPLDWTLLAAAGALGVVGHGVLTKALTIAPASALQPFNYSLLVWATAIGFAVFGDLPDAWTIAGAVVIVGSGVYTAHRERVRR